MEDDKAKNHILPISQLGIMQMTRQRQEVSISTGLYTGCPYCNGRGIVKSPRTISVEIQRQITSVLRRHKPKDQENGNKDSLAMASLDPSVLERLPTPLRPVVRRATAHRPDDRFRSARQMARAGMLPVGSGPPQ